MKVVKLLCVVLVGCLALLAGLLLPRKSPVVLQEPERTFLYRVPEDASYLDLTAAAREFHKVDFDDSPPVFMLEDTQGRQMVFNLGMQRSIGAYEAYLFFEPGRPGRVCVHAEGYLGRDFREFRLTEKKAIADYLLRAYRRHVENGGVDYHSAVFLVPMSMELCFAEHLDLLFHLCGGVEPMFELDIAVPMVAPSGNSVYDHEHEVDGSVIPAEDTCGPVEF
jgi:hypothetical protein